MFKVGDLVKGAPNNGQPVFDEDCLLEVINVYEDSGIELIDCRVIAKKGRGAANVPKGSMGSALEASDFEIASQEFIDSLTSKPKKIRALGKIIFGGGLKVINMDDGSVVSTFNPERREEHEEPGSDRLIALEKLVALKEDYESRGEKFNICRVLNAQKGKLLKQDYSCFEDLFSEKAIKKALKEFQDFFKEFNFKPGPRFMNVLEWKAMENPKEAIEYSVNYMRVFASSFADAMAEKAKSAEYKILINTLALADPVQHINKRLDLYFGAPGTGKTTLANQLTEGRCIVCNESIIPKDLIDSFRFDDGKPSFGKTMLRRCIEEGKCLTLDEINLLPFETLRFLQGLTDGKREFIWDGGDGKEPEVIQVHPDFKIIGTMNLELNGDVYGLPEPLVDRCAEIREFKSSADDLYGLMFGDESLTEQEFADQVASTFNYQPNTSAGSSEVDD